MKVSRAELIAKAQERETARSKRNFGARRLEMACLLFACLLTIAGVSLVYHAKAFGLVQEQTQTVNLNELTGTPALVPSLGSIGSPGDQEYAANRIYDVIRRGERFGNVGALARLRVSESDLRHQRGLSVIPARLQQAQNRKHRPGQEVTVPLLTSVEIASAKPHLRVRDAESFRNQLLLWTAVFVVSFLAVHAWWSLRGFRGDNLILPIICVCSGIGMILMVSLRDPLRDTLIFTDFGAGVVAGCFALCVFSSVDYARHFGRLSYVPLALALLLAFVLGVFGSGPGSSDAKVNLLFFQPMEVIRILLVFFLAGYFAQNWDALRYLKQRSSTRWSVPRLDYVIPVIAGVALAIGLFFWLSDLGPALVLVSVFLSMYSVARNRVMLAAAGFCAVVSAFAVGYFAGYPHTVRERVEMWIAPWDNHVHGGDQLADSLWALATGGVTGTGLGLGDSQGIPAAHTDLVVSAFGEQAGILGILALYCLYAVLIYRTLKIATRGANTYSFFLALGIALVTAYQLLLITGGLLGLIPLSGVVSPFLSYGKTSMVANFILFGIVLAVSHRADPEEKQVAFRSGMRVVSTVLAVLLVIVVARFVWVGGVRADSILVQPSLVMQADGVRRYQYNPRLLDVARQLPKGTIFDRNGVPLATSDWAQIESHRADYAKMGVNLQQTTSQSGGRQYPFGGPMFYLLGDVRSRLKQGASNTLFQESASRIRLQGYDDVAEVLEIRDSQTGRVTPTVRRDLRALIPLLRHRYQPDNPAVKQLLSRPRDVRMSISAALQMRASDILLQHLNKLGKTKGALVVMDPSTGDTLASVSYPWPAPAQLASLEHDTDSPLPNADLIDRARFGLYPPGSSFKIVTAIAALRRDPGLAAQRYDCIRLPDHRVGNFVWKREIRDDIRDTTPHGTEDLRKGIVVSCNAFFAQLGAYKVGANMLFDTASKLGIEVASPDTPKQLQQFLPQASYGQGQVVASPFQMARVAATVANGGTVLEGRWILDETNTRTRSPEPLLPTSLAGQLAEDMRAVVTGGTARNLAASSIAIAGKTGTAELAKAPSHAWFIGFAPYGAPAGKQIAFAILVENGQYGGTAAAPIAADLAEAARQLGII